MKSSFKFLLLLVTAVLLISGCSNNSSVDVSKEVEKETDKVSTEEVSKEESNVEEESTVDDESNIEEDTNSEESKSNENTQVNFDIKAMEKELLPKALEVFDAYAEALETGDKSKFHGLVDKYIINEKLDTSFDEAQSSKDNFDRMIDGFIEANDKEIVESFVDGLRKVNIEGIEIGETFEGSYGITFDYQYLPEGFYSRAYVKITYKKLDNGDHVLEEIRVS